LGFVVNDVENLRKRAKRVVRDHRAGQVTLAERLRQGLPRFEGMTDAEVLGARFALSDARQLIAHELGFASWADLTRASDLPSRSSRVRNVAWRSYAQVFVRDVARSTAWYRDVLGFEVEYSYGKPPFYAQLRRSEAVFNLRGTGSSPWVSLPGEEELMAVRVEVGDVKAPFLEVRDKGAAIHRSLRVEPWGQVTFVVCDLDDNLISFGSPMP
jgi:catechol 2,3-dioxygenase-like lactoylglutathione lyase family enzyme